MIEIATAKVHLGVPLVLGHGVLGFVPSGRGRRPDANLADGQIGQPFDTRENNKCVISLTQVPLIRMDGNSI